MKAKTHGKLLVIVSVCLIFVLALTACASKTALTAEEFSSKATALNLKVQDYSADYSGYDYINSVSTAYADDGSSVLWSADFIVADSSDKAGGMFENNKSTFESVNGTAASVSTGDFNTYERNGGGKFMYLGRVGATLLYIDVAEQYKADAKKLIEAMGY